jgi:hypothetical protein
MSNSNQSSKASNVFFGAGLLVVFGFLVLILSNYATRESLEERAYRGDFDAATIEARWENLKAVQAEQAGLYDAVKVEKAMAAVVASQAQAAPSDVVVPGSPTFMKQMEQASQEAAPQEEESPAADEEGAGPEGSEPEESASTPGEKAPVFEGELKSEQEKPDSEKKESDAKPEPKPAPAAAESPKPSGGEE